MPSRYSTTSPSPKYERYDGLSSSFNGKVSGSFALGFTFPNRISHTAPPTAWPPRYASITPFTLSIQGISTGEPLCSTTMVFGCTAATFSINSFWQSGIRICCLSKPSDSKASGSPAKITAVFAFFAASRASSKSFASVSSTSSR